MALTLIEKLSVKNFRNLDFDLVEFSTNINCIFGQNGNGKTNLLEAIYYLFTHKSFRKKTTFPQILSMDSDNSEIIFNSVLNIDGEKKSYSGKLNLNGQTWFLDNEPYRKKIDNVIVLINPFDASQFYQLPAFRKDWINDYASYYSDGFKEHLKAYNKLLKMKNSLLKSNNNVDTQLKIINKELVSHNYILTQEKKTFVSKMNEYIEPTFRNIFDENHRLFLEIDSKISDLNQKEIEDRLNEKLIKEKIIGHSIFGVHRDDYLFKFNDLNASEFCSLGQQKMSYLSLLFAYTELFRYKFKAYPMIFMDDVSGELDTLRWNKLIHFLEDKNFQVFISTANDGFKKILENINGANKIYIEDGQISS